MAGVSAMRGVGVNLISSLLLCLLSLTSAYAGDESDGYKLGPGDKLEVRVYDLRTGSGEAHQWTALNGEFLVGAQGAVSLPLLGEVPASAGTTADLAASIASRLQAKIGLAQLPDASVQVIKYRPFYIMGAVSKAGEYEYRPQLTVIQAVSMAGGMARASDGSLLGLERDTLMERGDLRVLAAERIGLLLRQSRLDAEIAGADTITLPAQLKTRLEEPDVARAVREEQLLFDERRTTLQSQVDAITQGKALLTQELNSLNAKDAALSRQLDLTKKELSQVNELVAKGLAVVPRQLAAEQSSAAFESNRLDVQLAKLRAQQDLSRADRDIIDVRSRLRNEALTEAAEVRAKLAANAEKTSTALKLIVNSEVSGPLTIETASAVQPTYLLTRRTDGAAQTRKAEEGDLVEPGDVIRVELPRSPLVSQDASNLALERNDPAPRSAGQ